MNILAGRFKGQKIRTIAKASYRPTTSRVRKSIFDMLGDLEGCSVLDLFSGSGILGFEAASRGAVAVTFVDNDRRNVQLLHVNSQILQNQVDIKVVRKDWIRYLRMRYKFDIIFADPPYSYEKDKFISLAISHLKENGVLILESSPLEFSISPQRVKEYGDTQLTFWNNKS